MPTGTLRSANMDGGPASWVGLGLSQHFVRKGGDVTFAEQDVAGQEFERVALRPAKIDMWTLAGGVTDVEQDRGDRVRYCRPPCPEHPVACDVVAGHPERRGELR